MDQANSDPQTNPQPRGDFVAFLNRDKQPGDTRPVFVDGRLTLPGTESTRTFSLWAHEFEDAKTGEVKIMFSGQADAVAMSAAPIDQVASLVRDAGGSSEPATFNNLKLNARQIVLFPNGFKHEAPANGEAPKNRPDYWGAFNPADGSPVVRVSVWMKKDRYSRTMLSGATSYPLPDRADIQHPAVDTELDRLIAEGSGARGGARGRKAKSGDEGRA